MSDITDAFDAVEASAPKLDTPTISDADQWAMEKNREPWVRPLKQLLCKIGPSNWPAWEGLVQEHGKTAVFKAAKETPIQNRWPDEVARRLDRKAANLLALKKHLQTYGLASSEEHLDAWATLLTHRGKCKSLEHCRECLEWIIVMANNRGIRMLFPTDASNMVAQWRPKE